MQDLVRKRLGTVQPDIAIYKLDLELRNLVPRSEILLSVEGAELVELQPHKRQGKHMDGVDEEVSDFESTEDFFVSRPDSESECTLASDVESGAEDEAEECPEEEEAEETDFGNVERLAPGSHVVFNNGYFTLANYALVGPNTDAKMIVAPRFCVAHPYGMGASQKSKTVQIKQFDDSLQAPLRTYIVLRCWSLWRAAQGDWLRHSSARKRWFEKEEADIRTAIRSLQAPRGTTGNQAADAKIREWAPQVLA